MNLQDVDRPRLMVRDVYVQQKEENKGGQEAVTRVGNCRVVEI